MDTFTISDTQGQQPDAESHELAEVLAVLADVAADMLSPPRLRRGTRQEQREAYEWAMGQWMALSEGGPSGSQVGNGNLDADTLKA